MVVFRSVLIPFKAALGFLLSAGAALGAVVAVFQKGWFADVFGVEQPGPVMSTLPILMIGVVFPFAMDYEVFLGSRMREAYVHGATPDESVVTGFRYGGRAASAAARRLRRPHGHRPRAVRPAGHQGVAAAEVARQAAAERGCRGREAEPRAGRCACRAAAFGA